MGFIFSELIYKPIYNLLIFTYNNFPIQDFGIAIILVTIITKLLLIPLSKKQIESQKKMQELQPKIKEVQEKYKDDKEKQTKAMLELYKTHKANPFSGCLPTILQLVFLIAIYRVLINISSAGLQVDEKQLYAFISNPGQINQFFLGVIDLSRAVDFKNINISTVAHLLLVAMAAIAQYIQTKMLMAKQPKVSKKDDTDFAQAMSQQMLYLGPLLTLFIGIKFPAGLALYWLTSTGFMIAQQYYIVKKEKVSVKK